MQELQDDRDACLVHLATMLVQRKGILRAHIKRSQEPALLCLHYDPNLISLAVVEETAGQVGAEFANRYHHERIAFAGIDAADVAETLNRILEKLPGMLHSEVNYAAGLAFVAYDTTILDRASINQAFRGQGVRIVKSLSGEIEHGDPSEEDHDHGSAPAFLPHWMQERWTLSLVSLAGAFFLTGWVGESFMGLPGTIAIIFFLLSYLAGGYDIATHAIPGLFKGYFDTDVLMLAAATGAALLGEWAEGAFLLFLFSVGHAGEHYALNRARNAVNALGALMPKVAQVKRGEQIVEEKVDRLEVGEIVVVRPGDRIPVDGEILRGASAIDQSAITGESVPVEKGEGDQVFAGTINQEASLDIRVTKLSKDNTLSRVLQMVTEAQSQQSPTQQFTQRFTARFVPAVLILVALVVLVPPVFGWMALQDSFYRGMLLLVAASPCALAIGTPASVLAGIAQAARNGVLIKGGLHLENLGGVSVMAFDKTGTLTEGQFRVTDIVTLNGNSEEEILQTAAAVEQHSNHPLALALVNIAYKRGLSLPKANGLENLTGRGVRSEIGGKEILIGSLKLFETVEGHLIQPEVVETIEKLENTGRTTMAISQSGEFMGVIALADTPRKNVKDALKHLLELGVKKLVMLTGDNEDVAHQIASEVGVTDVRANLLPEEKLAAIQQMQKEFGGVAMTGDGVNDAPALATATVGIAMGGAGTAVALETADVALMADDIGKLPYAVGLSRASRKNIRQNLTVSLGVIGLLLITSVFGLVQLSWAVVLHEGSTIIVVLNALRLLRYRLPE